MPFSYYYKPYEVYTVKKKLPFQDCLPPTIQLKPFNIIHDHIQIIIIFFSKLVTTKPCLRPPSPSPFWAPTQKRACPKALTWCTSSPRRQRPPCSRPRVSSPLRNHCRKRPWSSRVQLWQTLVWWLTKALRRWPQQIKSANRNRFCYFFGMETIPENSKLLWQPEVAVNYSCLFSCLLIIFS